MGTLLEDLKDEVKARSSWEKIHSVKMVDLIGHNQSVNFGRERRNIYEGYFRFITLKEDLF